MAGLVRAAASQLLGEGFGCKPGVTIIRGGLYARPQCKEKPKGDKYGFTHFARLLCSGKGLAPLGSDSRRRPDRAALEWGDAGTAGAEKYALEEAQRAERRVRTALALV